MTDVQALVLALAALAGAVAGAGGHLPPLPFLPIVAATLAALALRRPTLLWLAVAALAGVLAQRSVAGLVPPPSGPVHGEVTLARDPAPDGRGGVSADVSWRGRRYNAVARASAGAALDDRLTGERVLVIGRVRPPDRWERAQRHRHLVGRIEVETVVHWRPGNAVTRAANGLRRTLAAGAESLPDRQQSLLAGLTLGDDRHQPPDMADAFEAAGLTHLLAVSGSNVAFVLVVAAPALVRLRFGPRLALTLAVLGGFALVTRFEPSVLRATAMAAVAATGAALGRPSSSRRALGLGVTAILLVDPLLATSLGFQLSALGAAGIVLGARPLERLLPGPRWLRTSLAVTVTAQLAVAPLLVTTFGSLPLASFPANVLAEPVAGPIMVWGLTGGLVAGVLGGPVAAAVHLPTRALLWWLDTVASTLADAPLGAVRTPHVAVILAGLMLFALATLARTRAVAAAADRADAGDTGAEARAGPRHSVDGTLAIPARAAPLGAEAPRALAADPAARSVPSAALAPAGVAPAAGVPADLRDHRKRRALTDAGNAPAFRTPAAMAPAAAAAGPWWAGGLRVAGLLLVVGAVVPAVRPPPPGPPGPSELGIGATAWSGDDAVVVILDGRARAGDVLGGLRDRGIRRVHAVVLRSDARAAADVADAVRTRWRSAIVLAPPGSPADATTPPAGGVADLGDLRLTVTSSTVDALAVDVTRPGGTP